MLLVGNYHGITGQYKIDPGGRRRRASPATGSWSARATTRAGRPAHPAAAAGRPRRRRSLITKPGSDLRGMNRNTVIVDGTKPGAPRCSSQRRPIRTSARQGRRRPLGLNGILVWKAANVWVQNLTACNFLGGTGDAGNEIWWNGGDRQRARSAGYGFHGSYLTATSTFYGGEATRAAQYGIFSSNWSGGTWDHTYASNFNDSGYYIGACQQICNQTVNHAHARVQRARLLGLELRRPAGDQELRVRQQRGRLRHQQPERRQPAAAERRLSRQRRSARSPTPTPAGCS